MIPTVTLETKCWEQDWRRILDGERLRLLAERNTYPFSEKILMINNVKNISVVTKFAERAVQQGWLTKYINVEEHAGEVLDFFSISRESLGAGYPYSIAELVGLFLCRSDFLLHYAGDCIAATTCDWVPKAVQLMSLDPRVKVCSLDWDENHREARGGAAEETDNFHLGTGFSDQCYLVRVADFRQRIYNETHPASARYPKYGGELFEKRVDSWMQNHGHLRATYKRGHYIHKNWPLPPLARLHRKLRKTWARKISPWFAR